MMARAGARYDRIEALVKAWRRRWTMWRADRAKIPCIRKEWDKASRIVVCQTWTLVGEFELLSV